MMTNNQGKVATRVGMVSSDPLRVLGLQAILEGEDCYEVLPLSAPKALSASPLDIVLIDSGATEYLFELLEAFRRERPKLRLMVMGPETDLEHVERVIGAGAKGYLSHNASEEELKMALSVVKDGSVWASRKVLGRLLERSRGGAPEPARPQPVAPQFTRREREVLRLLVLGHPNREIARALGVDEGTVKAHMGRLMRKMGVANRTALTMQALERDLS